MKEEQHRVVLGDHQRTQEQMPRFSPEKKQDLATKAKYFAVHYWGMAHQSGGGMFSGSWHVPGGGCDFDFG